MSGPRLVSWNVNGIRALRQHELRVQSLQEHHHPATAPFAN